MVTVPRRLSGKVAMVTGGAWGVGRGISLAFAREGALVAIGDTDAAGAEEVVRMIASGGGRAIACRVDVSSAADVEGFLRTTLDAFGHIDILVNNAGIYPTRSVVDMSEEEWDRVINVNLNGTFLCSRAVARVLLTQGRGGRIINVASSAGLSARPQKAHYCASKAGVILFTKALALELAEYGITVNSVCPGLVVTEKKAELLRRDPEEMRRHELKVSRIPMGRTSTPEDVARVVVFLASEDAAYVTGQHLAVDGGASAGPVFKPDPVFRSGPVITPGPGVTSGLGQRGP